MIFVSLDVFIDNNVFNVILVIVVWVLFLAKSSKQEFTKRNVLEMEIMISSKI